MDLYYTYLGVPWDNPFDSNGKPKYVDGFTDDWWSRDHINPFHTVDNSTHNYKGFEVNYDLMFDFKITDWLTFKTNNRLNFGSNKAHDFISPLAAGEYNNKGFVGDNQDMSYGFISTNLFSFNKKFNNHAVSAILGYEFQKDFYEFQSVQGSGLPEGFETPAVISREQKVDGYNTTDVFESLISQVNYSFDNTFFLSASFRADATSNFPKDNRIAYFPSVSGSWIASNMSFLEDNNWLSLLKFRASFGITGDPDIGAGRYLGLFNLNSQYNGNSAAVPYQLANPDLTWEKTNQINFGFDLGFFERISLSFDMYNNTTKDLLVLAAQPLSQGFEYRWENNGVVKNNGFEITLSTVNFNTDNFRWTTDFTFARNKNELSGIEKEFFRTVNGISQIYRNGAELYTFVLPKWLGVDPDTGGPLWEKIERDSDGNIISRSPTSNYAEAEPQEVGKALPDFTGGITSNMEFFNFTLYMNFAYQYGNDIYNFTRIFMDNDGHEPYYNNMRLRSDWSRWQRPGDNATHPSMQNNSLSKENSSRYLESGDFFKIRTIGLRYNLPQNWVAGMHLKDFALGFSLNNVYTFTDYWGQDPEVTVAGESWSMPGVSDFKYPNNRQYLFNIDIKF
jgi:TonB-linked SusC/RagA family outer membrane protein